MRTRSLTCFAALVALLALTPALAKEGKPKVEFVEGSKFPILQGKTWKDETFDLNDHLNKGKYLLVDFWAAWCGPCRRELPNVVKAMNENQNDHFEIVTVSLDNPGTKSHLAQLVKDNNLTFPIVTDWKQWKSQYVDQYGVFSIPANFLLAPDGTVLMRDLHGDALVNITKRFATDPTLDYKPIDLSLTIANPPPKLTDKLKEAPTVPLDITLHVTNPQVTDGTYKAGIHRIAYIRTGTKTLLKKDDGTFYMDTETNKPMVFEYAKTQKDDFELDTTAGTGEQTPTFNVTIPDGTMDVELIPYAYSPALGMNVDGKEEYPDDMPSYASIEWLSDEELTKQGGVIDPSVAATPEEQMQKGKIYF